MLIQAHVARARLLVIAVPDTFQVRKMIEVARRLNPAIETVVRERSSLDKYEAKWNDARALVTRERSAAVNNEEESSLDTILGTMNESQLRDLLKSLPVVAVKRALGQNKK